MPDPWTTEAHRLFKKFNIKTVGYVPDAGLTDLINSCEADNDINAVVMTTEEEGIGLSAGAWLGGDKSAVLMQSSGVGNTVNAIASIIASCQFPLFMIVTMRGQFGESNPWLKIDLGDSHPISYVQIDNRPGHCGSRLGLFELACPLRRGAPAGTRCKTR